MIYRFYIIAICILVLVAMAVIVKRANSRIIPRNMLIIYFVGVFILAFLVRQWGVGPRILVNPFQKYIALGKDFAHSVEEFGLIGIPRGIKSNELVITEIVLNILLFVPLGVLIPWLWTCFQKAWKTILLGFVVSLVIECLQYVFNVGCFDTADLINNVIGTGIGYFVFCKLKDKSKDNLSIDSEDNLRL